MSKDSMIAAVLLAAMNAIPWVASAQDNAEPKQGRGEERFKAADKDGNGTLSKEEVSASMPRLASRFDALDTNKDDQLSPDELRAARAGREKRN